MKCRRKRRQVRRTMVIDIVGTEHKACELLQQVTLFVGGSRRANHTNGFPAIAIANLAKLAADVLKGLFPRGGDETSISADERLREPVFVIGKIETVAAFNAEEVAVDSALVAIVAADDFHASI